MGFYYRKSVNLGPFRVNLSKFGVGYLSVVTDSALAQRRVGKNTSFSIPGTGVGYRKSATCCLILLAAVPVGIATKTSSHNMNLAWKRALRAPSSEHFLGQREGKDVAAVDLNYLPNETVVGTVILLKNARWKESDVPALLGSLDEDFLPDVDLNHGNLNYTVVLGEVLGNFEAQLVKN